MRMANKKEEEKIVVVEGSNSKEEEALHVNNNIKKKKFPKYGEKLHQNSTLDDEGKDRMLKERKEILFEALNSTKIKRLNDISIGEYIPQLNVVRLIQLKGKVGNQTGFSKRKEELSEEIQQNPILYVEGLTKQNLNFQQREKAFRMFYPEEALYLMDSGLLCLIVENQPSKLETILLEEQSFTVRTGYIIPSIQEAYSLLLSHSTTPSYLLNSFMVYAYLRRLGFIVYRHDPLKLQRAVNEEGKEEKDTKKRKMNNIKTKYYEKKQRGRRKNIEIDIPTPSEDSISRNWWEEKEELIEDVMNCTVDNNKVFIGSDFLSDHSLTTPLICDLYLEDTQCIEYYKIYEALNVIQLSYSTNLNELNNSSELSVALPPVMFDVWKSGSCEKKGPPSMIIIVTSFSQSTVPEFGELFKIFQQYHPFPIFYSVVGDTGSIMFLNLCPFEIENLITNEEE
ncbi:hypothetical protein ABK040_005807 [Willaertia magna]